MIDVPTIIEFLIPIVGIISFTILSLRVLVKTLKEAIQAQNKKK